MGKRVLGRLAENLCVDTAALARELGASESVVRARVDELLGAGVVQGFALRLDAKRLGQSFEFLVTGAPTERTDRAALARLCDNGFVTRVFGLASAHSVAFTVRGDDQGATRARGLELAQAAGLARAQAVLIVTTFQDRAASLVPPGVATASAGPKASANAPTAPAVAVTHAALSGPLAPAHGLVATDEAAGELVPQAA